MGDVIRTEFGQVFEDDDDFEIEVSDLRTGAISGRDSWRLRNGRGIYAEPRDASPDNDEGHVTREAQPYRSPFARYLSRRQRASRAAITLGVVMTAFLAITLAVAPFLYAGLKPGVAQPLPRGADHFYFVPNVPWGTVVLDGERLTHLPQVGSAHPLRLARGSHMLEWLADPFTPFHCTLSVPRSVNDTCATQPLIDGSGVSTGTLITEHESLLSLHRGQRQSLREMIDTVVRGVSASATIQPGEHYRYPFMFGNEQTGWIAVADRPLKATMNFVPVMQTELSEPCNVLPSQSEVIPPCRAPGQDCRELCTLTPPGGARARSNEWLTAVTTRIMWTYSTLDGTVTMSDATAYAFNITVIVLRIVWDGTVWHVTPEIGENAHLAAASDISCASARELLIDGLAQNQLNSDLPTIMNGLYSSSANAATGCVVMLPASPNGNGTFPSAPLHTEVPTFLERFGVLLAANDAAHALWPLLPQATPHERVIAEALSHGWA